MKAAEITCIGDAQKYIATLYPNVDRDFSYVFGYAARHLGYLGKSLNHGRPDVSEFVRSVSWLLALANKIPIDVENALIERHPNICPYCINSPCCCLTTDKRPANGLPAHKVSEELFHKSSQIKRLGKMTFQDHADRIAKIYSGNLYTWNGNYPVDVPK